MRRPSQPNIHLLVTECFRCSVRSKAGAVLHTIGCRKKVGRKRDKNVITKPRKWQAIEIQCTISSESKGRAYTTAVAPRGHASGTR